MGEFCLHGKKPSLIPWHESWSRFSRRICNSDTIISSTGWIGQKRLGKDEMLILLFVKLVDSSNPIGWSSTRQISCLIRLKRKRAGYVKDWAWRTELLIKIAKEIAKKLKNYEEIAVWKAVRTQQLKLDELPMQQKENFSTVNQLLAQIQDSHDKVNSLNDAKDFFMILKTASSAGLSHVPNHSMSILSLQGMVSRDSCLPHDTRILLGTSGKFLRGPLARGEPSSALLENSKKLTSSCCGLKSIGTDKIMREGVRREPQDSRLPTNRFLRSFATWEPLFSNWRKLFSKLYDGKSETSNLGTLCRKTHTLSVFFSAGRSVSRLKYDLNRDIFQSQCCGSKK